MFCKTLFHRHSRAILTKYYGNYLVQESRESKSYHTLIESRKRKQKKTNLQHYR